MIYLAQPYFHIDPVIMNLRAMRGMEAVSILMKEGCHIFSPITHCHEMAVHFDMPRAHDFWLRYDRHMLDLADSVALLMLSGWVESRGVKMELEYSLIKKLPVFMASWECVHGKDTIQLIEGDAETLLAQMK